MKIFDMVGSYPIVDLFLCLCIFNFYHGNHLERLALSFSPTLLMKSYVLTYLSLPTLKYLQKFLLVCVINTNCKILSHYSAFNCLDHSLL